MNLVLKYKAVISFILLAVIVTIFSMSNNANVEPSYIESSAVVETDIEEDVEEDIQDLQLGPMPIYICGEVLSPGVYLMNEGDLVIDLVLEAQGMTEDADTTAINLAQPLEANTMIVIPKIGDNVQPAQQAGNVSDDGKVNINTATEAELRTLSGIGDVKALAIIDYRTANGNFTSIEDIKNVTGIGDKTFEAIQNNIKVN
ncbi:MAG: hypothetical protein ATN34_02145 [Epulopiscium sp. Nele67-Bin002]|nr:MAG: hypothetical protein ATN34_02145 [Epulopiscium sp. Nele67-Bin002]OON92743.1 MAG: hypothetical protein ATN33_06785 [Epulopiscium sp. Nele67-Bin001]